MTDLTAFDIIDSPANLGVGSHAGNTIFGDGPNRTCPHYANTAAKIGCEQHHIATLPQGDRHTLKAGIPCALKASMRIEKHAFCACLSGVTTAIVSSRVNTANRHAAISREKTAVKFTPQKRPLGSSLYFLM
nr:hypothetical protein [Halomonas meridiana]